jgi:hypothetical protein
MGPLCTLAFACAAASLTAAAALAQDANYTSVEATSGKPVQTKLPRLRAQELHASTAADDSRHRSSEVRHADGARRRAQD